jgi:NADH dehydrogenase
VNGPREVVVFGGTGFLGRRVVHHLLERGWAVRVAARHAERAGSEVGARASALRVLAADIADARSTAAALGGAFAVVNAVSLYVERGGRTFRSMHVEAAARVAELAHASGVTRLAHLSGIGADPRSRSPYIRSRGEGEDAVLAAFPQATIVRPAVMFGTGDAFLMPLARMLRSFPAFPMFGHGETKVQPAHVEDVAEAIARAIEQPHCEPICELGGPRTFTYAELLRTICDRLGRHPILVPVPFAAWRILAFAAEALPAPPITRNQVELMMGDSVVSPGRPGFQSFGIEPRPIEEILGTMVERGAPQERGRP